MLGWCLSCSSTTVSHRSAATSIALDVEVVDAVSSFPRLVRDWRAWTPSTAEEAKRAVDNAAKRIEQRIRELWGFEMRGSVESTVVVSCLRYRFLFHPLDSQSSGIPFRSASAARTAALMYPIAKAVAAPGPAESTIWGVWSRMMVPWYSFRTRVRHNRYTSPYLRGTQSHHFVSFVSLPFLHALLSTLVRSRTLRR